MSFKNLLKPTRNLDPHEIEGGYRTDYTGQAGYVVKVSTNNPDDDSFYAQGTPLGASYDGIYSNKWICPKIVSKADAGDTSFEVLGITVQGTVETDPHGNKVNGFNQRYADENNYAVSGAPVQIAKAGNFWLDLAQLDGTPAPGKGLILAAGGRLEAVDVDSGYVSSGLLVGKCLSTSGTRQTDVNVELKF